MQLENYPILYVDDEHPNRIVMKHALGTRFNIVMAESGEAALEILEKQQISVLLTDHRMPGMTGVDLAEVVLKKYPDVVRIIITAYSDLDATVDAVNRARINRFIKKPWTNEELGMVLEESLLHWRNTQLVKQLQGQLVELDRVTSLAIMASSIAHDLRQPLSFMEPSVTLLRDDVDELLKGDLQPEQRRRLSEMAESLADLAGGVQKFQTISNTLLKSLRSQTVSKEVISLNQAADSALVLTRAAIARKARLVKEVPSSPLFVMGSEGRASQLLVNLLINASQAVSGEPSENCISLVLGEDNDQAVIKVCDTGPGIPEDMREQIFKPFYTTKGQQGSGLGLAICKQIVEEMEGTIAVESGPKVGTCFIVRIPRLNENQ